MMSCDWPRNSELNMLLLMVGMVSDCRLSVFGAEMALMGGDFMSCDGSSRRISPLRRSKLSR